MSTQVTLERYAEMRAEMDAGSLRDEVLARAGLTTDEWTDTQRAWLETMGTELERGRFELTNRYTHAFVERQRALSAPCLSGPPPAAEPPPVSPPIEAPAPPLTPAPPAPAASPPIALPLVTSPPITPRIDVRPSEAHLSAAPMTEEDCTQTMLVPLDAGKLEALPFRKDPCGIGDPPQTMPVRVDAGQREAIPFKKAPGGVDELTRTIPVPVDAGEREALPFRKAPRGESPAQHAAPPGDPQAMKHIEGITLAEYAGICAELTAFPEQVVRIRSHHGMDVHAWTALHALWQEHFQRDPTVQARWEALVQAALMRRAG